jgi:hypothetical protein
MKYMIFPGGAGGNFLANIITGNESQPDNISNEYFAENWVITHNISTSMILPNDEVYFIHTHDYNSLLFCWVLGRAKKLLGAQPMRSLPRGNKLDRWLGLNEFNNNMLDNINILDNIKPKLDTLHSLAKDQGFNPNSLMVFRSLITKEPLGKALIKGIYHKDMNERIQLLSDTWIHDNRYKLLNNLNVTHWDYAKIFIDIDVNGTVLEPYKQKIINYTETNIKLVNRILQLTNNYDQGEEIYDNRFAESFRYVEDRFRNRRNEP